MASTDIYRATDATVASGYSQKWTWSGWVKRTGLGTEQGIFSNERTDSYVNSRFKLRFKSTDKLSWECKDSGGSDDSSFETNALYRDTNGWYHICFVYDTDNGTENDRWIIYVNGENLRNTSGFSSDDKASSGFGTLWSSAMIHQVGRYDDNSGNSKYFDGCMSHIHLSYGYALAPTVFGETDSTTGEWKIKTSPSVTYGSQGYFILKDGNSLTDQSGESNDFTLGGGTLTNTEDNPSDVLCTLNPLDRSLTGTAPTIANGNTLWIASGNSSSNNGIRATLGASAGKYYFEFKAVTATHTVCGIHLDSVDERWDSNGNIQSGSGFYGIDAGGAKRVAGVNTGSVFTALTNNDIVGFAFDLDNNKFWASVNGTWIASGDPSAGTNTLGTLASGTYLPIVSNYHWDTASNAQFNFGNGYFGTTAITSEGTNASNIGKFEYDVPTGFTALSTKGFNE